MAYKDLKDLYATPELKQKHSFLNGFLVFSIALLLLLRILGALSALATLSETTNSATQDEKSIATIILFVNIIWIVVLPFMIRGLVQRKATTYYALFILSVLGIAKGSITDQVVSLVLMLVTYNAFKKQFPGVPLFGKDKPATTAVPTIEKNQMQNNQTT